MEHKEEALALKEGNETVIEVGMMFHIRLVMKNVEP